MKLRARIKRGQIVRQAIALCLAAASAPAWAEALILSYSVQQTGPSLYHYDFTLTLANQDHSWIAGQQWDWIIFADRQNQASPLADFRNYSSADPNAALQCCSVGEHNGPAIDYGTNSALLPGWQPSSVGSTLRWSGDANTFLEAGQLQWSTLNSSPDTVKSIFAVATFVPTGVAGVPEPATWSAMLLGFGLLGAAARRHRSQRFMTDTGSAKSN